jgi:hypothetical protein
MSKYAETSRKSELSKIDSKLELVKSDPPTIHDARDLKLEKHEDENEYCAGIQLRNMARENGNQS